MHQVKGLHFIAAAMIALAISPAAPMFAEESTAKPADLDGGIKCYRARKYFDALQFFLQAVRQYPENADAHYYLALCYHSLRLNSQAEQQYDWVLTWAPDSSVAPLAKTGLQNLHTPATSSTVAIVPASGAVYPQPPVLAEPGSSPGDQSRAQNARPGEEAENPVSSAPASVASVRRATIAATRPSDHSYGRSPPNFGSYGRRLKVIEFYTDW
jgi:tetratricopeptide (TPR) repeat protein